MLLQGYNGTQGAVLPTLSAWGLKAGSFQVVECLRWNFAQEKQLYESCGACLDHIKNLILIILGKF